MDNKSSTNYTRVTNQLDKMILDSNHSNSPLVGDNVTKTSNMSIIYPRSPVILIKGVVVTTSSLAVVGQISFLMNVKSMKTWREI